MHITRRSLVGGVAGLTAGGLLLPRSSFAMSDPDSPELMSEEVMFSALNRAMDAAKAAGAEHVEASLSRNLAQRMEQGDRNVSSMGIANSVTISVGIRVMINGRWGHAASNQFEGDELVRLAKAACSQARANSKNKPREMNWVAAPALVAKYVTPGTDPFSVPQEEKIDFINSWRMAVLDYRSPLYETQFADCVMVNDRTERAFVNSSGSKLHSTVYTIFCQLPLAAKMKNIQPMSQPRTMVAKGLGMQQAGWEIIAEAKAFDQIPEMIAKSAEGSMIGLSPVDIGRYDVVCDAATASGIISQSVISAAELDRAIGLEANAGGTSYLGPDPSTHLGSAVGNEKVNLSVNRTLKRGLATIPWDAEGVAAKSFQLVKEGKLVDYMTNRELAPMLNEWYSKNGGTPGSNGCSSASSSSAFPIIGPANIRIEPGQENIGEEELISDIKKGYLFTGVGTSTSFQRKDGFMNGVGREIVNGKLGPYVQLGALFNATELLKNLTGIGGIKSQEVSGGGAFKGQPFQRIPYSIESVPLRFTNMAVIDPSKKI